MHCKLSVPVEVCGGGETQSGGKGGGVSWRKANEWTRQSRRRTAARGLCCPGTASCATGSSRPAPWSGSARQEGVGGGQRLDHWAEPGLQDSLSARRRRSRAPRRSSCVLHCEHSQMIDSGDVLFLLLIDKYSSFTFHFNSNNFPFLHSIVAIMKLIFTNVRLIKSDSNPHWK